METPSGWEYVRRRACTGIVGIIAFTDDDELVLVEQFRPAVDRSVIALPAGLVGDEGDPEEGALAAARRELLEETGFEAQVLTGLARGPLSAGSSAELMTLFVARGLTRTHAGGGVDGECITVHLAPMDGLLEWIRDREAEGLLVDPKILIASFARLT